jgi:hypothetical protein
MVAGYKAAEEAAAWLTEQAVVYTETNEPHEQVAEAQFRLTKLAKELEPPRSKEPVYEMPLAPIVDGQAGGTAPVQDPGPEGAENTPLPPGWIDGDAILPPSLRTGANVGGAKGNDGVDWAHSRRAATNPSREDTGGGGGKETYIQREGKNSLISQPERDDGAGGGGSNGTPSSGTPQNSGGSTDPLDGSAWTGPTRTEDPGPINTTSSEGVMAGVFSDANDGDDDDGGGRD